MTAVGQAINSLCPYPCNSLFDFVPDAQSSIIWKILLPTSSMVFCPVDNSAAIDVYVLLLPVPKRRVGRELEGGSRHEAECGAPTRCETDQIGSASDLAGHSDRVVARSVHEDEALGGHRFCVLVNVHQVRRAGLDDAAERLFQNCCQPTRFIPRRQIVVPLDVVARRILPTSGSGRSAYRLLPGTRLGA